MPKEIEIEEEQISKAQAAKQEAIMDEYGIPEEFKSWIRVIAYDQGHSAGYDEVLVYVRWYSSDLAPVIANFKKRILAPYSIDLAKAFA